jgi:hypothetical protein
MSAEDFAIFKEREEHRKKRRAERLAKTDDFGWSKHTDTHWYRMIHNDKLHYWPSANKWLWRGKYYRGGLPKFLKDLVDADNERIRKEN